MGRRRNVIQLYADLPPEELHTHVRKNISIPKYMDIFLYEHNISLSKLVQKAIEDRMREEEKNRVEREIRRDYQRRLAERKIAEERKKNPRFEQKLLRAKQLVKTYFDSLDNNNRSVMEECKQEMLREYPELYVDISRFENWLEENREGYEKLKIEFRNPVERLIQVKQLLSIKEK